ncbi:MAG: hypothetical protein QXK96_01450 [Candidatus Bathyarchaeia archaeon]
MIPPEIWVMNVYSFVCAYVRETGDGRNGELLSSLRGSALERCAAFSSRRRRWPMKKLAA